MLGTAVVYGTDVFCAVVMRPALESLDNDALVAVMGRVHRYGDRRMPLPGIVGIVGRRGEHGAATVATHWSQAIVAGVAVFLLLVWLVLYIRISAPINRQLTAAAEADRTLPNGLLLQAKWDRIIDARAVLSQSCPCLVLMM